MNIKGFLLLLIMMISLIMLPSCFDNSKSSDYFKNMMIITKTPRQYEKLELALYENKETIAKEGNPYDYNYFKIIGEFTAPSGKKVTQVAFWYQHAEISLNENDLSLPSGISGVASNNPDEPQGREIVTAVGNPHYRIRLLPDEEGLWTYQLKVYKRNSLIETIPGSIKIASGIKTFKGFLKVDETNKRFFTYENGQTYVPIGQNLAWYTSSTRKSVDYDVWFGKMSEVGMNIARIWLATWGFALHWGTSFDNFSSRYASLTRLDNVIDLASKYNIKIILVLLNHGQFSSLVNPEWNKNPWNIQNGGILEHPIQFFTLEEAKQAYKNQLLYLIARYGYFDNLMSWELFNEVDYVDGAAMGSLAIKNWHNEMANFIKTNDPYHHMITTSYKGSTGGAFNLSSIDFVSPHSYDYAEKSILNQLPTVINSVFDEYQKPVLQAELGINWQNGFQSYLADPNGYALHHGLWAGMMGGGVGGAMNWWWDSQIHPYNMYEVFRGAASYAEKLNLTGSDLQLINDVSNLKINNSQLRLLGYHFNNRLYGYLYDGSWTYKNYQNITTKLATISFPFNNGTYQLTYFNPTTGEVISQELININNGICELNVLSFRFDIAFILE